MQLRDYCKQDAYSLAKLIREKQLSPEEALDFALMRMYQVNSQLNAIVTDCSDWARKQLKLMQGNELFYGVPVLVKDLGFTMDGVPYTAGSRFYASTISSQDSDFIKRLLALGMLPFAKTNVAELGLSYVTESVLGGPCRNPYDLARTSGGSSGGSAAAVAAGVAPIATATDGGGSIRIPAACCGLFGFKPSSGLVPTGESWSGLATAYVLTRSVRDSALLFELITARSLAEVNQSLVHLYDKYQKHKPLTIALLEGAFAPVPVAKPCREALEHVVEVLKDRGYHLIQHNLALDLASISDAVTIIIAANTCAEIENQQDLLGREVQKNELEPVTWEFMMRGKEISAAQLIRAKNRLYQLTRPVHELLTRVDVILTPALAQLPLTIGSLPTDDTFEHYLKKNTEFSPFTSLFNQAGLPAMTIPVMTYGHLPLSVQFAAAKGQDRLLFELAMFLQTQFPDFTQPVFDLGNGNFV
jgi:amidase